MTPCFTLESIREKAMKTTHTPRYTLDLWRHDMGSFKQPGCRNIEDALWHVNKAREHDGLWPIELDELEAALSRPNNNMRATFTPEY